MTDYENRWVLPDWRSALLWSRARNAQGMKAVLDILGESANAGEDADGYMKAYLDLVQAITMERLYASVSVKVSALGYKLDRPSCLRRILELANECASRRVGFEIDMEGRSMVDFTLDAAKACAESRCPVTLALQAYLDRTTRDAESALSSGVRVRLVKGAYAGDFSDFMDIQGRFKNLARVLIEREVPFCVGTHDPDLIVWTTMKAADFSDKVEFGLLKGLSDRTKLDFVKNKWKVSEYIPFGDNKAPYESRRRAYLLMLESIGRQPAP